MLAIIPNIINNVIDKILDFEVKNMNSVLSKQESEFINSLKLNEKSKNTVDKYARDVKDFILWSEGMGISATSLEKIDKVKNAIKYTVK